jgi:hypothetical protein
MAAAVMVVNVAGCVNKLGHGVVVVVAAVFVVSATDAALSWWGRNCERRRRVFAVLLWCKFPLPQHGSTVMMMTRRMPLLLPLRALLSFVTGTESTGTVTGQHGHRRRTSSQ